MKFSLGSILAFSFLVLTVATASAQTAPVFGNQPTNENLFEGQYAAFYANTITFPASFQWQRLPAGSSTWSSLSNSGAYTGIDTPNLTVAGATYAMSGDLFRCVATNTAGSTTSMAAALTVTHSTAPVIYNGAPGVTVDTGGYFSVSPTVYGATPLTFQWKKNGVVIAGATDIYYSINNVAAADAGQYTLTATNQNGTATSSATVLTVTPPTAPFVSNLPDGVTLDTGASLSLSPNYVYGTQPMTFQWKKNGVAIGGATQSYFSLNSVTVADAGQYTLVATNSVGTQTSAPVVVSVNPPIAPVISNLPSTVNAGYGDSMSLYPSASGTQPMTWQWKKNGTAIPGATSLYYYVSGLTPADAGQYTLTATNQVGTMTSTPVVLMVNPAVAPQISNLPYATALSSGDNLSISSYVTGTQPMTFQWKKNGVAIPGATSSYYFSSNPATPADAGQYTLTATNQVGTVTSTAVSVTVNPATPPTFPYVPSTVTVNYGESLSINPAVSGTQPMTFQWNKEGIVIPGATAPYYTMSGATAAANGQYTLTATNQVGTATSTVIAVTVNPAVGPQISNMPTAITFAFGDTISIGPVISGTQPITYQWKKNGVAIPGATGSYYYSSSGATAADAGQYTLTATNLVGTVTSTAVAITVNPAVAPVISGLPSVITVNYGDSFSLYTTVSGTQPMTFQWKKDGVAIPGATSYSYYAWSPVTPADSGQYTVTVTNVAGTVTSAAVAVTVNPAVAPAISGLPSVLALNYGDSLNLSPSVTGTQPITYQWKKDGGLLLGATSQAYNQNAVTVADGGQYTLTATNAQGTVTSAAVTVTVNAAVAPTIFNLPTALVLSYGYTLSLSAAVTGTQPMTLQWKKDGVVLAGANSTGYSKSPVTPADSGQYMLTAINTAGTATSATVTVTVNPAIPPSIFGLPSALTLNSGDTLSMSPTFSGTQPMAFQWKKGGVALPTATTSYYSKSGITTADSGQYTLTVINQGGTVTSTAVAVTVNAAVAPQVFNLSPNMVLNYGDGLYLSATVTGTPPLTLQWKKGGVAIPGATGSTYNQNYATTADSGQYTLTATNAVGTVTSASISVTINPPILPTITSQPGPLVIYQGQTANFSVAASGTAPFTYQWYFNGQPITGATNGNLAVPNVQSGDTGNYKVVVTNAAGSTASNNASLSLSTLGIISASAVSEHTLLIKSDGTLWAGGNNNSGQLGDGTKSSRANPVQVATGVVVASAGWDHSLFVKSDGTLWAMGGNSFGQLGNGTYADSATPIEVASGVVWASAGYGFSLFIKNDGTLWAMGSDYSGQLGDGGIYVNRSNPVQVATGVKWASAGQNHSLYVRNDGTLWAMGENYYGELGDGTFNGHSTPAQVASGVISARAGRECSFYLKSDNTLWAFGEDDSGQLGDGTTVNSRAVPTQVASGVASFAVGYAHTVYVKTDGTLWGMGGDYSYQLGQGSSTYSRPNAVQIDTGVVSATAGQDYTLYLKSDGTLWATGSNSYGQLGDGTTNMKYVPGQISSGTINTPSAPGEVTADSRTPAQGVVVTWSPPIGATSYEVWRSGANNAASATKIATNVPLALFYDLSPLSGANYYWIKAVNLNGTSAMSNVDTALTNHTAEDFDGDGKSDIMLSNTATGERAIWLMNGNTIAAGASLGMLSTGWVVSGIGDFDGDGKSDLVLTNTTTGERVIWLMNGASIAAGASLGIVPTTWVISGVGDFDGDGKADLALTNTTTGERAIWLMNGTAISAGASLGILPAAWKINGVGDFNGDGKSDLVLTNTTTGERAVWLMNGMAISAGASLGILPTAWAISGVGDFDGDDNADIVLTNTTTGERAIWLMNGTAIVAGASLGVVSVDWTISLVGDFNGDGKSDLVLTNTVTGARAIWLMNGTTVSSNTTVAVVPPQWTIP